MRAREFVTEAKTVDYEGLTLKVSKNDHELMVDALDDWGNKVLGHVKFNIGDGRDLDPQSLRVDEKYRGQGIAESCMIMSRVVDYVIHRSPGTKLMLVQASGTNIVEKMSEFGKKNNWTNSVS
jgi:ribosomal protein S18 acetylase RimI-like enzyme